METAGAAPQVSAGRKRIPNRERPPAEEEALSLIAHEGEARLAAKRAARAEAREIRMKELEKQQKEVEEKSEKDFEKDSLTEVEEKYKKAMVSNAQLDNEKTNFMYQVETLQDALLELEEQLAESKRQFEEKSKDFEREKHAHAILQFQFMELKETLKQKEELLAQYGMTPNLGVTPNGEIADCLANDGLSNSSRVVSETSHAFKVSEHCKEDIRLKRLLDEREFLLKQPLQNDLKSLQEEDGGILVKLRKQGSRNIGKFRGL